MTDSTITLRFIATSGSLTNTILMDTTGTHITQAASGTTNTFELISTVLLWNSKQIATTDQISGGTTSLVDYVGNVSITTTLLPYSTLLLDDNGFILTTDPGGNSVSSGITTSTTGIAINTTSVTGTETTTNTISIASSGIFYNSQQIATTDQIPGSSTDLSHYSGVVSINDGSGANFVMNSGGIALYYAAVSSDITHELTIDSTGCYIGTQLIATQDMITNTYKGMCKESELPTTGNASGDFYVITDFDESSPGKTAQA
jgi:hypothetical protein